MKKISLPVSEQRDFHDLLLFAIVEERQLGWFYETYINCALLEPSMSGVAIIDFPGDYKYSLLRHAQMAAFCGYDRFKDRDELLDNIVKRLEAGFYAYIWIDHFCVEGNTFYQKRHFVHPFLIYGFDEENNTFSVVELDHSRGTVKRNIDTACLLEGYFNGIQYRSNGAEALKPDETAVFFKPDRLECPYPLNLKRYIAALDNYLNSRPSLENERLHYLYNSEVRCGLKVHFRLAEVLKKAARQKILFGYTSLHRWVLHRKYLYDSLRFIERVYRPGKRFSRLVHSYSEIYEISEAGTLLNIKHNVKASHTVNSLCRDRDFIDRMILIIGKVGRMESEILPKVKRELEKYYKRNKKILDCRCAFYKSRKGYVWNHGTAMFYGISPLVSNYREFAGEVTGCDNYLFTIRGDIDLDKNKYVKIRFRQLSEAPSSMMMFTTDRDCEATLSKSVRIDSGGSKMKEYIIDMSECIEWSGKLDMFRFYPIRPERDDPRLFELGRPRFEIESVIITDRIK